MIPVFLWFIYLSIYCQCGHLIWQYVLRIFFLNWSCWSLSLSTSGSDGKNGRVAPTPPERLSTPAPWWPAAFGCIQLEPAAIGRAKWPGRPSGWAGGNSIGRCFYSRTRTRVHAPAGAADTPRQASALRHPSRVWGAPQRAATWNISLCSVSFQQQTAYLLDFWADILSFEFSLEDRNICNKELFCCDD